MAHHIHKKRLQKTTKRESIDYIIRFFMVATPLAELPQAVQIYESRSARDVSIVTWMFFALASSVWLVYSFKQKLFPFVVAYSLYLAIEISIVIGIVMYS